VTGEELLVVAETAGDMIISGLWSTSRTARVASLRDMLDRLDGDDSPEAAQVRSEITAQCFAELDAAAQDEKIAAVWRRCLDGR
jgi:hypothetical protein